MWILIAISIWSPIYEPDIMEMGTFITNSQCEEARIIALDAGIGERTNEGLLCLELQINGPKGWWSNDFEDAQ